MDSAMLCSSTMALLTCSLCSRLRPASSEVWRDTSAAVESTALLAFCTWRTMVPNCSAMVLTESASAPVMSSVTSARTVRSPSVSRSISCIRLMKDSWMRS